MEKKTFEMFINSLAANLEDVSFNFVKGLIAFVLFYNDRENKYYDDERRISIPVRAWQDTDEFGAVDGCNPNSYACFKIKVRDRSLEVLRDPEYRYKVVYEIKNESTNATAEYRPTTVKELAEIVQGWMDQIRTW